jgi:hypothetical protein
MKWPERPCGAEIDMSSSSIPHLWELLWAPSRGDSTVDPWCVIQHRRPLTMVIVTVYMLLNMSERCTSW